MAWRLIGMVDPVRRSGATEQARPIVEVSLAKADAAAQRAVKLDPKQAGGYDALAAIQKLLLLKIFAALLFGLHLKPA
jgi:hypothetical protein